MGTTSAMCPTPGRVRPGVTVGLKRVMSTRGVDNTQWCPSDDAVEIARHAYVRQVRRLLQRYPVVCLIGARQVGKSTLARAIAAEMGRAVHFDLEDERAVARLADPMLELGRHRGLVVLDEIQRRPELFPALRVLADERPRVRRFLVLGSAAPALLAQGSESLAGRVAFVEVGPFDLGEIPGARHERLWLRGGFPRAFLAPSEAESLEWRRNFRQTFLERDLPMLAIPGTPAPASLGRYWAMLAHVHAELLNWSELGRSMGVSDATTRRYADVLEGARMLRILKPWHENISKRQVKSPKLYFRDTGLLHLLLGVRGLAELETHPRVGASWEGFVIEQLLRGLRMEPDEAYFWRTEHGAELDLLFVRGARRVGFEIKRSSAPTMSPSMHRALEDLGLERLYVIHAGRDEFELHERVTAMPSSELLGLIGRVAALMAPRAR